MTKEQMTALLRSVGVNENTVTAMENAYEMGFEYGVQHGINLNASMNIGETCVNVVTTDQRG
jgi:uncharacterized protein YebE (UPF0316 family)